MSRAGRKLDVVASISARASGSVDVAFQAGGATARFSAAIDGAKGELRITRALSPAQARAGSGTLMLTYRGDADTQPLTLRLLAASRDAALRPSRPAIVQGRLRASGAVSKLARGSVRVELRYGSRKRAFSAPIVNGHYRVDKLVPAAALREMAAAPGGVGSYVVFSGDKRAGVAGQSAFYDLPAPR